MTLTVLSIGYALAPVGPDVAGGAEQILSALDHALVAHGHRSIVVAPHGSAAAGTLVASPAVPEAIGDAARRVVEEGHRRAVAAATARWRIDVVHAHGLDFATQVPAESGAPTLVTLHLPAEFYSAGAVSQARPDTWFNPVSQSQARSFPPLSTIVPPIANGVPIERLQARHARRNFALALGRICPEKGFHLAIAAARAAGMPLLLAGQVYPYSAHQRYFAEQIATQLGNGVRFIGPVGFARKRRLLHAAQCLLVPSLVAETSSLVAMEALACGTPVIAFRAGALPEIVEPGITGFLVDTPAEMAVAIERVDTIDRERCRSIARARFSAERMIGAYLALYERLAAGHSLRAAGDC